LGQVNTELGRSATAQIDMNDSGVRTLFGISSGAINMNTGHGKSNRAALSYTYSANAADVSLNLSGLSGYSAGKSDITVTINSGVYLYATSTSSYGLNLSGGTTGDTLTIVNNGYIMGQGGQGRGVFDPAPSSFTAGIGGPAVYFGFGMASCTINNTNGSAYIGGGGGGGAGAGGMGGGGGAGGGAGGVSPIGCEGATQPGGAGGGPGLSGGSAPNNAGAGGGRIFPGASAYQGGYTAKGGEAGGQGGQLTSGSGGTGGGSNNPGGAGSYGGGGGGWGASGGQSNGANATYKPGSVGGNAINLNGKSVTWTSGDTTRVYGSVA
jgi:hypothetical protein